MHITPLPTIGENFVASDWRRTAITAQRDSARVLARTICFSEAEACWPN